MEFEKDKCSRCQCTNQRDPKTVSNRIQCFSINCSPCAVVMWSKHINILDFLIVSFVKVPNWCDKCFEKSNIIHGTDAKCIGHRFVHNQGMCANMQLQKDESELWIFVSAFQGWVRVQQPGQCCGTCKRTACRLNVPGLPAVILNVCIMHQYTHRHKYSQNYGGSF